MILLLDGWETLLLVNRIHNDDTDFYAKPSIAAPLLLKIFSVFNELVTDKNVKGGTLAIEVSQAEAWLLRKCVSVKDTDSNGIPIGIILLRKIHQILLDYNFPPMDMSEAFGGLEVMNEERYQQEQELKEIYLKERRKWDELFNNTQTDNNTSKDNPEDNPEDRPDPEN